MITNPENYTKFDKKGAEDYTAVAENIFKPIYPLLARFFIEKFNSANGVCVDIGSGTAGLARAIAQNSAFTVYAVDHADEIQNIAEKLVIEERLTKQVKIIRADVLDMPFEDNFADLIVSRGSLMFWKELPKAFSSIYRILKPGGYACIGGGAGSPELKEQIKIKMQERNPNFKKESKERFNPEVEKRIELAVKDSRIPDYTIDKGESGFWVIFTKKA